jgi:hypothetical protein
MHADPWCTQEGTRVWENWTRESIPLSAEVGGGWVAIGTHCSTANRWTSRVGGKGRLQGAGVTGACAALFVLLCRISLDWGIGVHFRRADSALLWVQK